MGSWQPDKTQIGFVYTSEADLLNVALFGNPTKQWRDANPEAAGHVRDDAKLSNLQYCRTWKVSTRYRFTRVKPSPKDRCS